MTGVPAALALAGLVLFLTVVFSMIVAGIVGGAQGLPLFPSADPPRHDPVAVLVFGTLIAIAQMAVLGAGLAPNSIFAPAGSVVLLFEPLLAIAWIWYLVRRYRRQGRWKRADGVKGDQSPGRTVRRG